jgi:hypothetical protein
MSKEKMDQIFDAAYEKYSKEYDKDNSIGLCLLVQRLDGKAVYKKPYKESFIAMCTHDKLFSEKWGLQITERELNYLERYNMHRSYINESNSDLLFELADHENFNRLGVPSKLIKIRYNNETIEVYE